MIRKVLVPLDGSRRAEAVLDSALKLVRARAGSLALFHAVTPAEYFSLTAAQYVQRQRSRAADYLRQLAERLGADGTSVVPRVVTGEASQAILAEAHRGGADLIAMSSHGRGGVQEWPFGSVAERVLRRTTLPVLVFRGESGGPSAIRRILIALDGSEAAMDVIPPASELAAALGASVVLVHVGRRVPLTVQRAVRAIQRQRIPFKARFLRGDPARSVLAAADEEGADLLALTTAGADPHERNLWGPVGRTLFSESSRPLLIVHPVRAA